MSDELNKYPGNLKHHNVDAPKREPLLFEEDIIYPKDFGPSLDAFQVAVIYEAARAKDAELIQRLVDLIFHSPSCFYDVAGYKCSCMAGAALELAEAAGFKPSEQ